MECAEGNLHVNEVVRDREGRNYRIKVAEQMASTPREGRVFFPVEPRRKRHKEKKLKSDDNIIKILLANVPFFL